MKYSLFILSILLGSGYVSGQITSGDGNFQVDFNEGCAPFTVNITSNVACPCNLYFNGGSGNPVDGNISVGNNTFSHTYDDPGTYELVLIGNNLGRDILTVTVHPNTPPVFTSTVCANRELDVNVTDSSYDTFTIDYGDGSAVVPGLVGNNRHTYAATGNYNVEVRGFYSGAGANRNSCASGTSAVTAVAVLTDASISALSLISANEATLEFTLSTDTSYDLEVQINDDNPNNFVTFVQDITGSQFGINNAGIDFESNYYCFRIVAIDPCNNTRTPSNTLCSIDLNEITINDLSNNVNINASANGLTGSGHVIQTLNTTSGNFDHRFNLTSSIAFDDMPVVCNEEICYRIQSDYGGAITTSLTKCGTALSLQTPSTIEDISIDASSDPILFWSAPQNFDADTYQVFSLDNSIGTSTTNNFTESQTNANSAPACYQIDYIDQCGNTSELSTIVCSLFLSFTTSNSITSIRWTSYNGWASGVSTYQVIKNGDLSNPVYTGLDLNYTPSSVQDEQFTLYQVIAIPNDGSLETSKSNILSITNRSNITFPNAFVVNGTNNEFKVVGRYIVAFDLKIYTRWGELIAHITDHNIGWDGTQNGKALPEGNYIYTADIRDEANNIHKRNGTVLLMRK